MKSLSRIFEQLAGRDWTPLEHAAIAAAAQVLGGLFLGNWWVGGLLGCCWFAAREHTQAEYRWIAQYGQGLRANLPWWGTLDPRAWTWGSVLDWAAPAVGCAALWFFLGRL